MSKPTITSARALAIPGAGCQAIEGNPLTPDEIEMFEMFEREGWPHERRIAYIKDRLQPRAPQ